MRNGEEKRSGALEWSNITGGAKGIAIAKAQGKYTGRPPKTYPDLEAVLGAWRRGEISVGQARKQLGVSKSTFYRLAANEKKEANKSNE